jgi:5-methylthioadenosine/S-adenosylhomocysteine deaminase
METVDILLVHGAVVTMDSAWRIFLDGAVAVRGNEIVAVGPSADLTARFSARETVDCRGCAIIPGLINAHAHVPMSLLRGLVADQHSMSGSSGICSRSRAASSIRSSFSPVRNSRVLS